MPCDEWLPVEASAAADGAAAGCGDLVLTVRIGTSLAEMQRQLILATLHHCKQHKERTAMVLDSSLKTLYNRLKEQAAGG